ncbi:MAG: hypothetical protein WC483_00260 [Candidatus Paceibacterota bacterium]
MVARVGKMSSTRYFALEAVRGSYTQHEGMDVHSHIQPGLIDQITLGRLLRSIQLGQASSVLLSIYAHPTKASSELV